MIETTSIDSTNYIINAAAKYYTKVRFRDYHTVVPLILGFPPRKLEIYQELEIKFGPYRTGITHICGLIKPANGWSSEYDLPTCQIIYKPR